MSPSSEFTSRAALDEPFACAVASLTGNFGVPEGEARRLCGAPSRSTEYAPGAEILPGDSAGPRLILSGWACEMRLLFDGRRQIFTFLVPGDISLAQRKGRPAAFTLVALTSVTCLDLAEPAGAKPLLPRLQRAVRQLNEARRYEAVLRLGQLSAPDRMLHLLLELRDRLRMNGTASGDSFELPVTQKQMADALGLSLVHVNRTLKALRKQSILKLEDGTVTLLQPHRLAGLTRNES